MNLCQERISVTCHVASRLQVRGQTVCRRHVKKTSSMTEAHKNDVMNVTRLHGWVHGWKQQDFNHRR